MNEKLLLLKKILSQKNHEFLNMEVIRSLLEDENDVNQADENGMCLLHLVVLSGYENTAALLIDKGANVNIQDNNGQTPLHFATSLGYENMVDLLINKGAQINSQDNSGEPLFTWPP